MPKFIINGGRPLRGTVKVSGSKNAVLPMLAATILTKNDCLLTNVPDIADVRTMIGLLEFLGSRVVFKNNRLLINNRNLKNHPLPHERVSKMRSSILLLGPLLARFGSVKMAFPGGCVIGKRSVRAHLNALRDLGAELIETKDWLYLRAKKLKPSKFLMWETSVTATENALMAAALIPGKSEIHLAAGEPHVQALGEMLKKMGAKIDGLGSSILKVQGKKSLKGVKHQVIGDYIEMGTWAVAAAIVPGSKVTITGLNPEQLDSFWSKLAEAGGKFTLQKNQVTVEYRKGLKAFSKLETRVYPGFPTDLQAPFALILTQSQGVTRIFETLYEGRFDYLLELEKMGAKAEVYNEHQALVVGPTVLKGKAVSSCDLRAGATLVLAGLAAKGRTEVDNINYIDRGYENFEGKLRALGAAIKRLN
ncbi:MAG: UDP-N-acetylglucosamine 1-carboxyvinyltransferase [Patescibacteria group bacterium]|jgi:UDP-N-acetylglucosamine 1-carboxyvinyltransferase